MMPKKTIDRFRQICNAHHCRCTVQRLAVYRYICGNTAHPSVDEIWANVKKEIPTITRESVFRIMMEFSEWGLVYRMDKITNARFDGIAGNHGHLICRKCGAIIDFNLPKPLTIPSDAVGFCPDHIELRVSGICAACAEKNGHAADSSKKSPHGNTSTN